MFFDESFIYDESGKNDFQKDFEKYAREIYKKWGEKAFAYYADLKKTVDDMGGLESFLKRIWNGEDKETDIFSFKECIEWVKKYFNQKKHSGAAVGKAQDNKRLILKVCFVAQNGEPLSDEESPYLVVRCNDIDKTFKNQFGDKDVILLK